MKQGNSHKQKGKNNYDYQEAASLRNYVIKRYRNQISTSALHLYQSLQFLEERGLGLCKPMTVPYRDMAQEALISIGSVKSALDSLKGILCEVEIGDSIKSNGKATMIRRFTLKELMYGEPSFNLVDFRPHEAGKLAKLLQSRTFTYGNDMVSPYWNVLRTGRVQSKKPNTQGDNSAVRERNLCAGLKNSEVLISADYKSAEPTIIQKAIDYSCSEDLYNILARLSGIPRNEAKKKFNMLAYSNSAVKVVNYWPENTHPYFLPYAGTLDEYKEKLWKIGAPKNKQRRFVHTLGGTKITADKGTPLHRGQILNWHIQGTVADILNNVCLKIITQEQLKGWKFCFPVHDSVYVIGKPEHAEEIKILMEGEAKMLNLDLGVETKIIRPCRHSL
jgi:hypothetical protein